MEGESSQMCTWAVPIHGNTNVSDGFHDVITRDGLRNWMSLEAKAAIRFQLKRGGTVHASLRLKVPYGRSRIKVSLFTMESEYSPKTYNKTSYEIQVEGSDYQVHNVGLFTIPKPCSVYVELQGVQNTGGFFADVSHLILLQESTTLGDVACIRYV